MSHSDFKRLINSDLFRYGDGCGWRPLLRNFFKTPGFRYSVLMRACAHVSKQKALRYTIGPVVAFLRHHYAIKYGISISPDTEIGHGFYIGHYGGIVVSPQAVFGRNCNISHGVTIGQTNRGERQGCPVIGDNVYIGPGAKIIGRVLIGNNVAVGANCVVTKDVPDNAVVVGVPGRIISYKGSANYINNVEPDDGTCGSRSDKNTILPV